MTNPKMLTLAASRHGRRKGKVPKMPSALNTFGYFVAGSERDPPIVGPEHARQDSTREERRRN